MPVNQLPAPTGSLGRPPLTGRLRLPLLALAGIFTASACSAFAGSAPLAVVPETSSQPAPGASFLPPSVPEPKADAEVELAAVLPSEAPRRTPRPEAKKPRVKTVKLKPRPKPGPFSMNLYDDGDFVHQQTKNWCVAGSTQTMMNIIDAGKPNKSRRFQGRLYAQGRRLSNNQSKLTSIGVDLTGWANLLSTNGYGRYEVDGRSSRRAAIRTAAKALRETGRPVGLVVWRGAHSWVMSGFSATADPAYTNDFEVKRVFIQDVWYPYVSTIWGASRPPNSAVPVAALAEDYLPYRRPSHRWPKRDGKFMLVLPALPRNTVAR